MSGADKDIIDFLKRRRIRDYESAGRSLAVKDTKTSRGLAIRRNRSLEETVAGTGATEPPWDLERYYESNSCRKRPLSSMVE